MSHSLEYGVHLSRRACRLLVVVLLILGAVSGASEKPQHAADPVLQRTGTVDTASSQDLNSIYSSFMQKMQKMRQLVTENSLKTGKAEAEEATPNVTDTANSTSGEKKVVQRYPVASISFHRVEIPFIIGLWIFSASLAKIGFHMAPRLNEIFPESCLLIFVGVVIGVILVHVTESDHISTLTPDTFFFYMLPPIILDAGYFMPNRLFFDHLGTILLFAVIGTIFNTVLIGASLFAIGKTDLFSCGEITLLDMLLFGSLVSAVDPVAVLAVFEEIQVNEILYIVVFGESLLNDAVTVVLYNLFDSYNKMGYQNIIYTDILAGFANFFVVAIGGTVIGVIWGFATAFVTRFTNEVRVIEPIFIFVMAYLAYMNAEIFHMSGILAITFCGITMKNYVEANISHKSHTTIKYTMKMLSSSSETIIFMFLGVATVSSHHSWNTWFVVMTILFCSVYRVLGVIILTAIANKFRLNQLNTVEKFVMSYGGLRGAVAFALVLLIKTKDVALQPMFMTTTIAVIYFTVFIQGITIKPLVKVLNVKTAEKRKPTMNERIHERLMDHTMAAIEDILGQHGNYHIRDKFKRFDNRFIRPYILRNHQGAEPKILETYSKLAMRDAMEFMRRNASTIGNISNTESMSAIFRNYTSGNLNGSASFSQLDSSTWNIDMQELEYNPSKKDLTDAKIHHLLAEELVKPYRRIYNAPFQKHRRLSYSRHAVNDRDLSTQVNYRMHVNMRRLVADKKHHHKRHSKKLNKGRYCPRYIPNTEGKQNHVSFPEFQQNGSAKQFSHDYLNDVLHEDDTEPKSSREEWDSPITFTAKSSPSTGTDVSGSFASQTVPLLSTKIKKPTEAERILPWRKEKLPVNVTDDNDISVFSDTVKRMSRGSIDGGDLMRVTTPTATETMLPWKRDEEESSGVVKQCEFPAWASNKEYLAYNSPSATFLDRKRTLSSSVDMSEPDEQPSTSGIENARGSVIGLFRRESVGSDHLSSCESTPQRERRGSTVILVEEEGDPLGALVKSREGSVPPAIPQPPQTPRQGRQQRRGSMLEISGSLSRDTIPEETLLAGPRRASWLPQRQTSQPSRPPLGRQQTLGSALMGNVSSPSISSPSDPSDVDEDVEFLMKAGF